MKCKFDVDGLCRGEFKGFECIEDKCELYSGPCEHLVNSYCQKYGRFFCAGEGDCSTLEEYMSCLRNSYLK